MSAVCLQIWDFENKLLLFSHLLCDILSLGKNDRKLFERMKRSKEKTWTQDQKFNILRRGEKTQSLASSVISYSQAFPLQWWIETYIDSLNFCALILKLKILTSKGLWFYEHRVRNTIFHLLLLCWNRRPCSLTSFVATQLIEGMLSAVFENVFVSISKSESLFTPYINK